MKINSNAQFAHKMNFARLGTVDLNDAQNEYRPDTCTLFEFPLQESKESKLLTGKKPSFAEVQLLYFCFLHHNIYFRYFTHKHVREIANTKTDLVR